MDLFRVVNAAGNIKQKFPVASVKEFLTHADRDFEKIETSPREKKLRREMLLLTKGINQNVTDDPHSRLRWVEDIMTVRCRL